MVKFTEGQGALKKSWEVLEVVTKFQAEGQGPAGEDPS